MQFKKKHSFVFLLVFALLIFPSVSALTITNTTYFSSVSGSTIFIDSITLDNVTVNNQSTEFYNLTSLGSNFTNTNTSLARADFYGLQVGYVIRNINTSSDLFTSTSGNQDYNATFTQGQLIRIMGGPTDYVCDGADRTFLVLTIIFFALIILATVLSGVFRNGELVFDLDVKTLLIIFIAIILGVIFIQEIANSISSFCPLS